MIPHCGDVKLAPVHFLCDSPVLADVAPEKADLRDWLMDDLAPNELRRPLPGTLALTQEEAKNAYLAAVSVG